MALSSSGRRRADSLSSSSSSSSHSKPPRKPGDERAAADQSASLPRLVGEPKADGSLALKLDPAMARQLRLMSEKQLSLFEAVAACEDSLDQTSHDELVAADRRDLPHPRLRAASPKLRSSVDNLLDNEHFRDAVVRLPEVLKESVAAPQLNPQAIREKAREAPLSRADTNSLLLRSAVPTGLTGFLSSFGVAKTVLDVLRALARAGHLSPHVAPYVFPIAALLNVVVSSAITAGVQKTRATVATPDDALWQDALQAWTLREAARLRGDQDAYDNFDACLQHIGEDLEKRGQPRSDGQRQVAWTTLTSSPAVNAWLRSELVDNGAFITFIPMYELAVVFDMLLQYPAAIEAMSLPGAAAADCIAWLLCGVGAAIGTVYLQYQGRMAIMGEQPVISARFGPQGYRKALRREVRALTDELQALGEQARAIALAETDRLFAALGATAQQKRDLAGVADVYLETLVDGIEQDLQQGHSTNLGDELLQVEYMRRKILELDFTPEMSTADRQLVSDTEKGRRKREALAHSAIENAFKAAWGVTTRPGREALGGRHKAVYTLCQAMGACVVLYGYAAMIDQALRPLYQPMPPGQGNATGGWPERPAMDFSALGLETAIGPTLIGAWWLRRVVSAGLYAAGNLAEAGVEAVAGRLKTGLWPSAGVARTSSQLDEVVTVEELVEEPEEVWADPDSEEGASDSEVVQTDPDFADLPQAVDGEGAEDDSSSDSP